MVSAAVASWSRTIGERLPVVGPRWRAARGLLERLAEPVPPRAAPAQLTRRAGGPLEEVALTTADGLRIAGWYLPAGPRAPVVLHHHFGATRHDYLPLARMLREAGHPVLLIDGRSHGHSDRGETLGLALAQRPEDVIAAATWLRRRRGHRAFHGYGFSMGAAVVLIGASRCPGLCSLVLDSGPVVHLAAACRGLIDVRLADEPAELRRIAARRLYLDGLGWRYRLDLIAAAERMPEVPALILHGERDRVLPPSETARLRQVLRGPCERVVFPRSPHVLAWAQHRARYRARVLEFLRGAERARGLSVEAAPSETASPRPPRAGWGDWG